MGGGEDGDGGCAGVERGHGERVAEVPCEYCVCWLFVAGQESVERTEERRGRGGEVPLWPNLEGSLEAPATAKRGEEKNVFRAASMSRFRVWPRVWGMGRGVQIVAYNYAVEMVDICLCVLNIRWDRCCAGGTLEPKHASRHSRALSRLHISFSFYPSSSYHLLPIRLPPTDQFQITDSHTHYHGICPPSNRKNLPLSSFLSPEMTSNMPEMLTSGSTNAPLPPIRVFTHPGSMQMTMA